MGEIWWSFLGATIPVVIVFYGEEEVLKMFLILMLVPMPVLALFVLTNTKSLIGMPQTLFPHRSIWLHLCIEMYVYTELSYDA
ncbi:hypothetical protein VNO77_24132 [Canavalia gladiata]|uniref:Uncharacterized protein n=1 Tax=Canavalia gladiata TaxID=3824 RepID=A0AAN9L931_CANGL